MKNKDISILIVDDEFSVRDSLYNWFKLDGYNVDTAADARETLQKFHEQKWDLVLLDIKLPGMDGLELQQRIRSIDPDAIVIIITAYASVETAVRALKEGAYDYITKPFDPDDFKHLISNAIRSREAIKGRAVVRAPVEAPHSPVQIIGENPAMLAVFEMIDKVAQANTTVLIEGDTGVGKEMVALAIHSASPRRFFPFVAVNCGAIPETLIESELFGYEKGAFTGAQYRHKGKIEMADGGTLFLDEVGDINLRTQVDLLRVLETKIITRIGGERQIPVDFRVICATNRTLEKEVKEGRFREDLFYRINIFNIKVPPLRERISDVPLLTEHFLEKHAKSLGREVPKITDDAMRWLKQQTWPGNVRELENAVERALVIQPGNILDTEDFQSYQSEKSDSEEDEKQAGALFEVERKHILKVLEETGWNISRSAKILNIDRTTLYNKIEKYNLQRK